MRIGEAATLGGLTATTLRYYEKRGLLPRPARTEAGYRTYSPEMVAQLRLITWAKGLGFTLREIRELVAVARDHAAGGGDRVRSQAKRKIDEVDARIARLQAIRGQLTALASCRCGSHCPTLARAATAPLPAIAQRRR